MNIGFSPQLDISTNYIMRLNDKEILVSEEDPLLATHSSEKKSQQKKEQEEKKLQETQQKSKPDELSEDEKRLVGDLESRDSEVRAHEAAHQSAGGGMTGAASYTYQQGPDGKMYAIGGEVSITTPNASSPQEAIKNARQVIASAMAAGDPSPQDFAVANAARTMEMKAEQQLSREAQEKRDALSSYKESQDFQNTSSKELTTLDISA